MYGNFQWADKFTKSFVIFTPRIFLCSPNFNIFSKLVWNSTVANKIKFFCGNWSMYKIIYKKLYQRELVTSDLFFVIRNNSGVQIFRNDEKARQRHLPKMYTVVVTMNWNRFRKIFRIRFCIFYNRSELSQRLNMSRSAELPIKFQNDIILRKEQMIFWKHQCHFYFCFHINLSIFVLH